MSTFDFGFGPVPAHRHRNPDGSEGGWVADTAQVSGSARVSESGDWILVGPIGSRGGYVTWTRSDNSVATGCFRGSVGQFEAAVKAEHKRGVHHRNYLAMIAFLRIFGRKPAAKKVAK